MPQKKPRVLKSDVQEAFKDAIGADPRWPFAVEASSLNETECDYNNLQRMLGDLRGSKMCRSPYDHPMNVIRQKRYTKD